MEPIQDELLVALDGIDVQPTVLPMISTVTGQPVEDGQCDKHYWWQNVRQSVRFAEAVDWLSEKLRCLCGIESPPDPLRFGLSVCNSEVGKALCCHPCVGRRQRATMLASLGALYTLGHPVDWRSLAR